MVAFIRIQCCLPIKWIGMTLLVFLYEVRGHPSPYQNLELFSNCLYQCECNVSGVWTSVNGEWKLDNGRICFSNMKDNNGRKWFVNLPTEKSGRHCYIHISDNASFKKRKQDK
ncbi:MAG: hypothetical protein A2283_15240 [Lentisphaerae bacterium RIFOXYA12_FULL_48_11]|nr:MAG: hypothetical protein A2283_15240 [Lentisphaerae bacterium RIFOXYA12_FULL_48_11]